MIVEGAFNLFSVRLKSSETGIRIKKLIDDKSAHKKWLETIESDKMSSFINLFNGNDISGLAKELKITTIPANYLVDSEGRIIATNLRGEQLQLKLKELIP
ncbi:MAG: hypothetical protein V4663_03470 [Bacteroidota bacterium]